LARASPCQGECRGFESRFPLFLTPYAINTSSLSVSHLFQSCFIIFDETQDFYSVSLVAFRKVGILLGDLDGKVSKVFLHCLRVDSLHNEVAYEGIYPILSTPFLKQDNPFSRREAEQPFLASRRLLLPLTNGTLVVILLIEKRVVRLELIRHVPYNLPLGLRRANSLSLALVRRLTDFWRSVTNSSSLCSSQKINCKREGVVRPKISLPYCSLMTCRFRD
jgi:hypothetical protein